MTISTTEFYKTLPKKDASPDAPVPSTPPSTTLSLPSSTPVVHKQSGTHTFISKGHLRSSLNVQLANETIGHFLGPMPPTKFLNKFLPAAAGCPSADNAFSELHKAQSEIQMYTPFIEAATPFTPGLTFLDTHLNPDTKCAGLAPDISPYLSGNCPLGERKTDFSLMEFIVEFKYTEGEDPFRDPEDPLMPKANNFRFEVDTKGAKKVRGQLSSYVSALLGSQFRLHTFVILVSGKYARLMFWDRSGATVTRRFIYAREGEAPKHFLSEFLWRYSQASPPQRGHDPTVRPASLEEVQKYGDAPKRLKQENLACHREFRIMTIPDRDDSTKEHDFLISSPSQHHTRSPFGRATRPMVACDMCGNSVFIKDYWRAVVPGIEKEGDIYKILEEHNVPHIAPFGVGNDVREYTTITHTLRNENWACWSSEMVPLRLYRMSMNVVGRSLTNFKSSREYVMAIADAMEAHDGAYFDANILHRDISVGNIIVTQSGEGLLIDWDLCLNLANMGNGARRPSRTGTWQFMSSALLKNPELPQDLEDDRESAFHVLSWIALRYTKHNKLNDLSPLLSAYDECHDTAAGPRGGDGKIAFMTQAWTVSFDERPALTELITSLARTISARYSEITIPEDVKEVRALLLKLDAELPADDDETMIYSLLSPDRAKFAKQIKAYPFAAAMLKIRHRGWLVSSIRRYTDDESRWPASDKAELSTGTKGKRKMQADFEDRMPSTKTLKLLNGDSSRASE